MTDYYCAFQVLFLSKALLNIVKKWFKGIKMWSLVLFSSIQMRNVKHFVKKLFSLGES